ncbi:hydrolase, alpha/beta fold superfamily [Renibacterium salmoninarum ATCC 33209]|uniref:Hydrolase, alpha/beta fold superfamily n=1 Tax=Renibacterium salmoninarum (strain ATCC 33209 / DSM 20767 / JCM 11484 / NBRC 15589 / NCIMB 2235) TaxID=288705 RepID=A9WRI1_RENSM|nr:hydrolase, alpha/beta fold superfamily [Renibacterium salmoninarum ATCC 33209]
MPVLPIGPDVKRISINGRSTRYIDVGEGPPLLLLHGIIRSLEDWGQVIDPLSKHYWVLAPDLAGFGFSDDIPEYTLDSLAEYLWGFLDAAGV